MSDVRNNLSSFRSAADGFLGELATNGADAVPRLIWLGGVNSLSSDDPFVFDTAIASNNVVSVSAPSDTLTIATYGLYRVSFSATTDVGEETDYPMALLLNGDFVGGLSFYEELTPRPTSTWQVVCDVDDELQVTSYATSTDYLSCQLVVELLTPLVPVIIA